MENNEKAGKSEVAEKEEKILKFWQENNIFEKSLQKDAPKGEFVFYDGPPFATGLPHYGSLLSSVGKDVIPRYKTMQGYFVRRRWGWDCHGLPIENIVEKKLGLKHKKDIEELGIEKFNEECRDQVLTYAHDWKFYIDRIARWVDFENSYKTMDSSYTESVWWALKQFYDKKMLYEGRKVLLYCPRCETPLSRAEIAMDNSYRDITEEAVTVRFEVKNPEKSDLPPNTYLLAWTTTPWTLPANVALAVGPEIEYSVVEKDDQNLIVASALVEKIFGTEAKVAKKIFGKDLEGIEYVPLYEIPAIKEMGKRAWYVALADFVTTDEGTGIVHTAVIYGEDDFQLGLKIGLPMLPLLLPNGTFNSDAPEFIRGMYIKKAEKYVKEDLQNRGLLFAAAPNTHSYPHCYRCDTPLIYNAISSWFIDIQKIKKEMIKLNERINWVPEHLKHGRFLDVMENAPDWTISRNRFWASPLPIWKCQDCKKIKLVGSLEELREQQLKSGNKYFVMRHGEADHNVGNFASSKKENPHHLTEKGRKEVESEAKKLKGKKITKIFCSPFVRTRETVKIVAETLGFPEDKIIYDDRLSEINLGEFDNKDLSFYRNFAPTCDLRYDKRPEGGENLADVKQRVGDFLYSIDSENTNENILIVTHEYPFWMMCAVAKGLGKEGTVELRGKNEDFIEEGESRELDFVPLPHRKNFELDFHRPYIDNINLKCDCGGVMTRIPEVIDCWVESGSMPFAEYHYPFQNKKEFEKRTPGDYVVEYIGQTRTWFYYMHAVSTALFGHEPFKNVLVTGNILAADGSKMSKSKGNYTDPLELMNKYGADALRYYLMTSVVMQSEDSNFRDEEVREINQRILNILRNTVSFFEMYRNETDLSGKPDFKNNILDKWIVTRLSDLTREITENYEKYDTIRAGKPIRAFVDDLSTWYLRRSRDRFKSEDKSESERAVKSMAFVLRELSKLIAPLMPFTAEEIYQSVRTKDSKESVHLEEWPKPAVSENEELIEEMKKVREIVTAALELRQKAGIKVRQPLARLSIKNKIDGLDNAEMLEIVKDEINVKEIVFDENISAEIELDTEITPELKREGTARDIIRAIQDARKAEGLMPSDTVELFVCASPEIVSIFEIYSEVIRKPTGVSRVQFLKEKQKHEAKLETGEMSLAFEKE